MYRKVLVPLDGSKESEGVLNSLESLIDPEGWVILLKVIPPMTGQRFGQIVLTGSEREEAERAKAMDYLRGAIHHLNSPPERYRCEVIVSPSVVEGITGFATKEGVDLIAMYTHDRKGLARLIRGSIAAKVQHNTPIEVRVFRPRDLAEVGR